MISNEMARNKQALTAFLQGKDKKTILDRIRIKITNIFSGKTYLPLDIQNFTRFVASELENLLPRKFVNDSSNDYVSPNNIKVFFHDLSRYIPQRIKLVKHPLPAEEYENAIEGENEFGSDFDVIKIDRTLTLGLCQSKGKEIIYHDGYLNSYRINGTSIVEVVLHEIFHWFQWQMIEADSRGYFIKKSGEPGAGGIGRQDGTKQHADDARRDDASWEAEGMSWNDGISKELSDYFDSLATLGDVAIESLKEQIDIEAQEVLEELLDNTPEGETGGLIKSLQKTKLTVEKTYYGYLVTFSGENTDGTSYEKIANILNYGTSKIKPRKFVTKVVKRLKGLDGRAAQRYEKKVEEDIGE